MFRQLNISNSFTMEATFCGTTICRYSVSACLSVCLFVLHREEYILWDYHLQVLSVCLSLIRHGGYILRDYHL